MATVLLGRTSAGTTSDFSSSGATACWKFTAAATGTLATLFAQTKVSNTATLGVLGIYADNGTGARPNGAALATGTVTTANFNSTAVHSVDVSAAAVSITAGTVYWLGWYSAGDQRNFQGDSSGSYQEFTGNFPTISATGPSSSVNAIIWGEDSGGGGGATVRLLGTLGVGS